MFAITEAAQWAQENFGRCDLGDKRRGARLVKVAGDLARHAGASLLRSCDGDEAAAEGLYRLLRNAEVDPDAIAEGGFEATAQRARSCELLLAVEDSTSLAYRHSVAEALGTTSSNPTSVNKGFMVHSVVLLDGCTGATVGLIEQRRWIRVAEDYGKSNERKRRAYEDKESFKWQQAGQAVRARLGEALSQRAIAVCDRSAVSLCVVFRARQARLTTASVASCGLMGWGKHVAPHVSYTDGYDTAQRLTRRTDSRAHQTLRYHWRRMTDPQ